MSDFCNFWWFFNKHIHKKCPRSGENVNPNQNFFKNVRNFPRINFYHSKTIINRQKPSFSKISWNLTLKMSNFSHFWWVFSRNDHKKWPRSGKKFSKNFIFSKNIRNFPPKKFLSSKNHYKPSKTTNIQNIPNIRLMPVF